LNQPTWMTGQIWLRLCLNILNQFPMTRI